MAVGVAYPRKSLFPLFQIGSYSHVPSHRQICLIELMTSDAASAAAFYRPAGRLGHQGRWHTRGHYRLLVADGSDVGGLMTLPPDSAAMGVPPCWTGYVGVDDDHRGLALGGSTTLAPTNLPRRRSGGND